MAEHDESFLSRWARRKAEPEAAEPALQPPPEEAESGGDLTAEEQQALVESLPDIDSLDETSDFSAFMQKGVPEALQRRALRKLWRLNPVFAQLDGLNDYDDDFTDAALVVEGMKTLFQVGKGMADRTAPEEPDETATVAEAPTEAETAADASEPTDGIEPESALAPPSEAEAEVATPAVESATATALAVGAAAGEEAARGPEVGSGRPALSRRWGLPET